LKKVAIAAPYTMFQMNRMRIVLAIEGDGQGFKSNAVALLCVPLCLFDLPDHPIIHNFSPFLW
jgi:hypothetical protein